MGDQDKDRAGMRVVASFPMQLAKAKGDGRTLVGYAGTWDQPITDAGGWFPAERMYLRRPAFTKTLKERWDQIKVLFNHGKDPQVGEKPLGKPQVMRPDDYGLWTETPLDDTSWNRDLVESLRSGAIDGMSMSFEAIDYAYLEDDPEALEVTQARLYEFGPVTFPAGSGTSATLMSVAAFDALHSTPQGRAEGSEASGRQSPPPTLAALTWRREALPVIEQEQAFLAEQRERMENLTRG